MGNLRDYVSLIRPNVCFLAVFGVLVGYLLSTTPDVLQTQDNTRLFAAMVAAFLACGAGNVINDYFDHKIDRINAPNRPIPRGAVKRKSALVFYVALSAVGVALAFYVSVQFFVIALVNMAVLSAYGWKLKRSVHLKNAAVSWLSSSSFMAGGLIENIWMGGMVSLIFTMSFLGTFSREVFKDVEDMKGDKKQGVKTLATVFGKPRALKVASILAVSALAVVLLPYVAGSYALPYLIAVSPGVVLGTAAVVLRDDARKSQRALKFSMYCLTAAFILIALAQ